MSNYGNYATLTSGYDLTTHAAFDSWKTGKTTGFGGLTTTGTYVGPITGGIVYPNPQSGTGGYPYEYHPYIEATEPFQHFEPPSTSNPADLSELIKFLAAMAAKEPVAEDAVEVVEHAPAPRRRAIARDGQIPN